MFDFMMFFGMFVAWLYIVYVQIDILIDSFKRKNLLVVIAILSVMISQVGIIGKLLGY